MTEVWYLEQWSSILDAHKNHPGALKIARPEFYFQSFSYNWPRCYVGIARFKKLPR